MADVLVVVAHPDDESFFAGGTVTRLAHSGRSVFVLTLADGVSARDDAEAARARRRAHFQAACAVLGVQGAMWDLFPDQEADTLPQLWINREVARAVAQYGPRVVFTHHVGDLNGDHRRVAEAVFVAARGAAWKLYTIRPEWPALCVGPAWKPHTRSRLDTWALERKVAACRCYADELRDPPHPRSEAVIRAEREERFMVIQ